ncbi:hypothetical protein [Plantactinospora sp. CA-290183]|uniref:hypothetical protein n=1 Tax=Plantactinospora sp. CA-290183 TaxID=3240006 RepID=UPI003D8F67D4
MATIMALLLFLLFAVGLGLASTLGLTVDSRDGADWAPSHGGLRMPRDHRRHWSVPR